MSYFESANAIYLCISPKITAYSNIIPSFIKLIISHKIAFFNISSMPIPDV